MSNIQKVFEYYVKDTPPKAVVTDLTVLFCTLTNKVQKACDFQTTKVHITTKVIKKNYDKRTAEENDFILKYGWKITRFPDQIYQNKNGKRGHYLFAKRLKNNLCVCSIEETKTDDTYILYAVALFRIRPGKERYLDSYSLIWSWKGGDPSS